MSRRADSAQAAPDTAATSADAREHARRMLAERLAYPELAVRAARANAGLLAIAEEHTLSYGAHPEQRLLTFVPREGVQGVPVVFVHGGSWASGSPERYRFVGRWLASTGRPAAVTGYRHAPGALFPAQRDDTADAVRSALAAFDALGLPTRRIVIAGQSAGAHLAALAAFDTVARFRALGAGHAVGGALLISGPLDFDVVCPDPALCPVVERLMGCRDGWEAADPVRFVTGHERFPTLAIHGTLDPIVSPQASANFISRVCEAGGDASLVLAQNAYHANLMGMFLGIRPEADGVRAWLLRLDATPG